jgi:hypothetical protein
VPDAKSLSRKYRMHSLLNLGAFRKHTLPVFGSQVIQVNIDGKSREIEDKEIQRGPAFEYEFPLQEGMTLERIEKVQQMDDFFEDIRSETGCTRFGTQPLG